MPQFPEECLSCRFTYAIPAQVAGTQATTLYLGCDPPAGQCPLRGQMPVVCIGCGRYLGLKEAAGAEGIYHGVCPECAADILNNREEADCPICGQRLSIGAPHDDNDAYQWECIRCGFIKGVRVKVNQE